MEPLPANFTDRPNDYLGGSSPTSSGYLQSPHRKKRDSWLPDKKDDKGPSGVIQAPAVFEQDGDDRRSTNSMVMQKLTALSKQNEAIKSNKAETPASVKQTDSSTDTTESADSTAATTESHQSPESADKVVIVMQRKDINHMADRPGEWLGHDELVSSHHHSPHAKLKTSWMTNATASQGKPPLVSPIQSPKTKLKTSWLNQSSNGEIQSLRDLTATGNEKKDVKVDLHASEPQLSFTPAQRRKTSPVVLQKLSEFSQKNEENHKKNELLAVVHKSSPGAQKGPAVAKSADSLKPLSDGVETAKADASDTSDKEKIQLIKDEELYLMQRPDTWMGGEGEATELSYLHSPHTKLKSTWLKNETGGSQSLRDVFSERCTTTTEGADDDMHASVDSHLGERRRTSTLVMEKLSLLRNQSEENHKRNEELAAVEKMHHEPSSKGKPESTPTEVMSPMNVAKEKIRIQRADHNGIALRPTDFLGVGEESPLYSPKSHKAKLHSDWVHN